MPLGFLIGIGAGMASAALFASAWTGTVIGVLVLFFLSPMPIAIAGLGWAWASGAIAALTGAVVVGITGGPRSALVYLLTQAAPAAFFAYLALLNRPIYAENAGPGDAPVAVEWYPVGRIVAWATLGAGLVAAAALLGIGSDIGSIKSALRETFDKSIFGDGVGPDGRKLTEQQRVAFVDVMVLVFPWAIATTWFAVAMLNMWAAGHVTLRSGRLERPWPDLSQTVLPPAMPLAFGAATLATFAAGLPGLIASGFASAAMFAFMLIGLAVLHRVSRGHGLRPLLLGGVYLSLVFLPPLSTLVVAMIGLAEPYFRRSPGAPPPST